MADKNEIVPKEEIAVVAESDYRFLKGGALGIGCGIVAAAIPQAILAGVILAVLYFALRWKN